MNTPIEPRCINCFFWAGNRLSTQPEKEQGKCHRFPIQVAGVVTRPNMAGQIETITISSFPLAPAMAWCGEFHPNAAEKQLQ